MPAYFEKTARLSNKRMYVVSRNEVIWYAIDIRFCGKLSKKIYVVRICGFFVAEQWCEFEMKKDLLIRISYAMLFAPFISQTHMYTYKLPNPHFLEFSWSRDTWKIRHTRGRVEKKSRLVLRIKKYIILHMWNFWWNISYIGDISSQKFQTCEISLMWELKNF